VAEPFLSEIRIMSFGFAPKGWALCNGQLMQINQNQALFSLLGTTFGGDGRVTFALPNLQGRTPISVGGGHVLGERGGEQAHTLSQSEMPQHIHFAIASQDNSTTNIPGGNSLASYANGYATPPNPALTTLIPSTIGNYGGSQPHQNMQPYTVLNFSIALQGIFPSAT
jgi:microcystin-dependent protein